MLGRCGCKSCRGDIPFCLPSVQASLLSRLMSDYTLSQIRALIDPSCFPPSATVQQQNNLINKAREAFYMTPPDVGGGNALWNGAITTARLPVVTQLSDAQGNVAQTVTLPRWLATVVAAFDTNGPIDLRNEWQTVGTAGQWGGRILSDMSNGWCGVTMISLAGATLTVTTTATEVGSLTITFVGTDVNGNMITETLNIPTTVGTVTTTNTFYTVYQVIKNITAGYLVVNQITAAVPTFFARYAPAETSPNYRRYLFAFQTNLTTVNVKAKRCYHQLSADTDGVEFGSILAFECAIKGYRWLQNNDMGAYLGAVREAIGYLNGDQAAYQSEGEHTIVQMQPEFSPGEICNIL